MDFSRPKFLVPIFFLFLTFSGCGGHHAFNGKSNRQLAVSKKKQHRHYSGKLDKGFFIWPVDGPINSLYGFRNGRPHDGIDIGGDSGVPVLAASAGEVVYCDSLGGYGNLIVIKHANGLFTAYGHNKKNLVKTGDRVKQGRLIARLGRTGNATGNHLHFEIRDQTGTYDPVDLLPKTRVARVKPVEEPQFLVAEGGPGRVEALPLEKSVPAVTAPEPVQEKPSEPSPQEAEVPEEQMMDLLSEI